MTPDSGILTTTLNSFLSVFSGGFGGVNPDARRILFLLSSIELTVAGIWWAMKRDEDVIVGLIQKLMLIGVFAFFVLNWPTFISQVVSGFINTGVNAGTAGGGVAFTSLTDPSSVIDMGFTVTQPISNTLDSLDITDIGKIILLGLAMILILIAFFILGWQITLTYLEFYIVAVLALILVPFGVNRYTSFLSEKAFGAIVGFGVKLMVLAFIMTAAYPVLANISLPVDPTIKQVFCTFVAAGFIAFLAWHAPGVAAGMMAGSPTLTAATAARTAAAAAIGALAGAGVAASTAKMGGEAARKAVGAATRGVSAATTAGRFGAATAAMGGAGTMGQTAGAARGVATLAGNSLKSVATKPLSAVSESLKSQWQRGQIEGFRGIGVKNGRASDANTSQPIQQTRDRDRDKGATLRDVMRAAHSVPPDSHPSGGGTGPKFN